MNKTKIDWADMTWNPVTGCLHGCEYCYARKIAKRFSNWGFLTPHRLVPDLIHTLDRPYDKFGRVEPYPFGFEPTFHKDRLSQSAQIKKPQNIFVCSMADLFGDWVPDEWIRDVFGACEAAPQHQYLFLTKNPARYADLYHKGILVKNQSFWYGTTITNRWQPAYIQPDPSPEQYRAFFSIEPILEPIAIFDDHPPKIQWVIVGAETGNRKGKIIPEKKWIDDILAACVRANVPIFMKESLRDLMGEDFVQMYPWPSIHGTV